LLDFLFQPIEHHYSPTHFWNGPSDTMYFKVKAYRLLHRFLGISATV
jgi:hypothetical protein